MASGSLVLFFIIPSRQFIVSIISNAQLVELRNPLLQYNLGRAQAITFPNVS